MKSQTLESRGTRGRAEYPAPQLDKILVAVDFSAASKNAFRHALALAKHFQSDLTVLYVVPPAPAVDFSAGPSLASAEPNNEEKDLWELVESARTQGVLRTKPEVRLGVPSYEIVEAAKEANSDLIVISTHGYTGWKYFCIGSTAERVVRAAPCPVMVIREKEHEFC